MRSLRLLTGPFLAKAFHSFLHRDCLCIVMEYLPGGDFRRRLDQLGRFAPPLAQFYLAELALALRDVHRTLVHRDLKPENVLYESEEPGAPLKLADFGVSRIRTHPQEALSTVVGSASYRAPEVARGQSYTEKCDIYSAGVILYVLLCGFPPFDEEDTHSLAAAERGELAFPAPEWEGVSPAVRALVAQMMHPRADCRPSAQEALLHPFLAGEPRSGQLRSVASNLGSYSARRKRVSLP